MTPGKLLWKRTLTRIKVRIAVSNAFRSEGLKNRLRRRRASILANMSGLVDASAAMAAAPISESPALDRWHQAIYGVVTSLRVVRAFHRRPANPPVHPMGISDGPVTNQHPDDNAVLHLQGGSALRSESAF